MRKLFELNRALADLQEKKSKLAEESKGTEVKEERLTAINTELDKINDSIKKATEERNAAEAEELELKKTAKETKTQFTRDGEVEKRQAQAKQLIEKRAVTISSGELATPTLVKNGINDKANEVSSIIDMVNVEDLKGMSEYKVPYVCAIGTGGKTTEGEGATTAEPTFAYASIKPVKITAYSEVTEEAEKLTPVAYYEKVKSLALVALKKKVSAYMINGDAVSLPSFIGINTSSAAAITSASDIDISAIDQNTLRKMVLAYGGDENVIGTGVLLLNKLDLLAFGDVRGTSEKKAVYDIVPDSNNPNTGYIKDGGLSVRYCINSNIAALSSAATEDDTYCMIYGILGNYTLGLFDDYSIKVSSESKFKEGMLAIKGSVLAGGNVTVKEGFVRAKK